MICAYEECENEFTPKTHNQKYCSDACCRIATNLKIKQRYYDEKDRKSGKKRYCSVEGCNNVLSRYNTGKKCLECDSQKTMKRKNELLDMIRSVSG